MKRSYGTLLLLLLSSSFVRASTPAAPETQNSILSDISFGQDLDAQVPLDLSFTDSTGQEVRLGGYFGQKPVILSLVYFTCPMLCTETLNGLTRAIRPLSWDAGKEFNIVTVSFDPRDTPASAAAKRKLYIARYGRADAGWAFLTGDAPAIKALADSVGFHYSYDKAMGQYAHATGIVILTPQGRVSHYFYGVEYSAKDMRLALIEASKGSIGSPVERLLLYCYHYDPLTGKYALVIMRVLRLSAVATVLLLAGVVLILGRRGKATAA